MGQNGYSTGVSYAVGCFDEHGETPLRDGRSPKGKHAETRKVTDGDGGEFGVVLAVRDGEEVEENVYTHCSYQEKQSVSNFFLCERCYGYLQHWLDSQSLPPRSCGFPQELEPLPFASELYEIVNSRRSRRGASYTDE